MILVTGATGFIGRSLGRVLTQTDRPWRAYTGRVNAPAELRAQLEGVDVVFHLAGAEARGSKRRLEHVDVEGTQRLIEECRRAGVDRIILTSRLNADPHAIHVLLRVKGEVERLVQRSGIPYTILRTTTLYGRDDRFSEIILGLALWSWPFVWLPGGGKAPVQPLWVEDYVRCLVAALDRPDLINQTVIVGGAVRFSYRQLAYTILHTAGLSRWPLAVPMPLLRPSAALFTGWWYWPGVSRYFVDRFFVPEVAELDSVRRLFGFQPASFAETITYLNRPGLRWRLFRR
jgi:NADH dehydrogenase